MRRLLQKFFNYVMRDADVTVGTIRVLKKDTMYTDSIEEQTPGAGVQIKNNRPNSGASFPLLADSKVGQFFYRTDLKAPYVFIGVGEPGTTSGWFNLKHAQYAA